MPCLFFSKNDTVKKRAVTNLEHFVSLNLPPWNILSDYGHDSFRNQGALN